MGIRQKGHFKDSIRRSLIIHALVPILFVTLTLLSVVFVLWGKSVVAQNQECKEAVAAIFSRIESEYAAQCAKVAQECDIKRLAADAAYRSAWYQELYHFANQFAHQTDFYILDRQRNVVCASTQEIPAFIENSKSVLWGGIREMHQAPEQASLSFSAAEGLGREKAALEIGRAIVSNGEIAGYVVFVLPRTGFLRAISNLPAQIVVTDQFGHVFAATGYQFHTAEGKASVRLQTADGYLRDGHAQYYINRGSLAEGRIQVYAITALNAIAVIFIGIVGVLTAVFFMLTCAIFISAKKIAEQKTRIIDELVKAFHSVQSGNLDIQLAISTNDEFETIGDAYNIMLSSIQDLIQKNNEQTRATVLSEIRQLESQFDPHFLFNTLEAIRFMANFDPAAVDRMVVNLSNLLRYSIRSEKNEVTVEEDIEYIQSYLAILNCRFGSRFNYVIDISEDAETCIIPKLIFQPVIENAVKYGFSGRESMVVRIDAAVEADKLLMMVRDDGAGMDEKTLGEVRAMLGGEKNRTKHIGLFNVHRRIGLMYGNDYGIEVHSKLGEGTTVQFVLPVRNGECAACPAEGKPNML